MQSLALGLEEQLRHHWGLIRDAGSQAPPQTYRIGDSRARPCRVKVRDTVSGVAQWGSYPDLNTYRLGDVGQISYALSFITF